MILQYLEAHPVTAQLSRGQRWVHLKRSIRLFTFSRVFAAAKMRRQALTALQADSRAAQRQYEAHPTDAAALLQWLQVHHTLQQLNARVAQAAALQARVVWQHYGEQSTFWFYHVARERREQTVIAQLGAAGQPGHITLDTYASTQQAGQALEAYFSASSSEGLFALPDTSPDRRSRSSSWHWIYTSRRSRVSRERVQQATAASAQRAHPDAPGLVLFILFYFIGVKESLVGLSRAKSPGFDGSPYEFYQRF